MEHTCVTNGNPFRWSFDAHDFTVDTNDMDVMRLQNVANADIYICWPTKCKAFTELLDIEVRYTVYVYHQCCVSIFQ